MPRRGAIDVGRLMNLVKGPGVDTRVWLSFAVVQEVVIVTGNNAGVYVDIALLPHGEEYTAWVGSPYAGSSAGLYYPMKVNDTVLVAIPYGDSAAGIAIIARFNAGDAPPPGEFADESGNPTSEVVLVAEAEANIRYVVSGAGNIVFEPKGTGKVGIGADPGSAGMEPIALAQTLTAFLEGLKTTFNTHTHATAPTGPISPPLPVIGDIPDIKATLGEVK